MGKVSIIIPFFNNVCWLEQAVQSALQQTYKNIEIVIVNDGSSVDVSGFLNKYSDLILYFYQDNMGPASARNKGISKATGEYIAFLDSDDIWMPDKLEKQVSFMCEIDAKWCHTNYYYWDTIKEKLKNANVINEYGDIFRKTFVSIRIATPSVVIKSEVLKLNSSLRFPEDIRIGEDTALWREISRLYPVALLKEPLVKVRLRKDNSYKKLVMRLSILRGELENIRKVEGVPFVAKFRAFIFYIYSNIIRLPSTPFKEFLARVFLFFPYALGRAYVNTLSFLNRKHKNMVK